MKTYNMSPNDDYELLQEFDRLDKAFIKELLNEIPNYGGFTIQGIIEENTFEGKDGIPSIKYKAQELNRTFVHEGFATVSASRLPYDIVLELTDKGRELKKYGGFEAYYNSILEDQQQAILQMKRENYQYYLTFAVAVATVISGVYYTLEMLKDMGMLVFSFSLLLFFFFGGAFLGASIWTLLSRKK